MSDKYDEAIAYLTKHPNEIVAAWWGYDYHEAGGLFGLLPKARKRPSGCATELRKSPDVVFTIPELESIKDDERIPKRKEHITVESLEVFAEWQRRADEYR